MDLLSGETLRKKSLSEEKDSADPAIVTPLPAAASSLANPPAADQKEEEEEEEEEENIVPISFISADECHRFLTALSVRPRKWALIFAHWFP